MSTLHNYFFNRNATSQMIEVYITDNAGKPVTGIVPGNVKAYYFEVGKSESATAATTIVGDGTAATYESNKFVEVDATNKPGVYKYSVPDAAFALTGEQITVMFDPSAPATANPAVIAINLSTEVVLATDGLSKTIVENGDTVGAIDVLQAIRGISAVLMGTLTGADTPELTFKGVDVGTTRVVMTTDEFFNRTAVVATLT